MHEIELIHKAVALEQAQRPVNRYSVNLRIESARFAQDLTRIEMLFRSLYHAEDRAALARHPQPTRHQFCLQPTWSLGLWEWHGILLFTSLQMNPLLATALQL